MENTNQWFSNVDKIWQNGNLVNWEDAKVHVLSHGIVHGSGVFEGVRCYNTIKGPQVFRLREHIERLLNSAKLLRINIPYTTEELMKAVNDTIIVNKLDACYIRPLVFYGYHSLGVHPLNCPIEVVIGVFPWEQYLGSKAIEEGVRCCFSSWIRVHSTMVPSAAKANGLYIGSMLAKMDAVDNGFDEALMLDATGNVAEACTSNIFIIKDGVISTPGLDSSILPGITRKSIIEMAQDLGYSVEVRPISKGEVYSADEIFLTGTAAEITPVVEVDHRIVGSGEPGPITKQIIFMFFEIVKGKNSEYSKWLNPVLK